MLDETGSRLERIRREFGALIDTAAAAQASATQEFSGTDETGAVEAVLESSGRVRNVTARRDWGRLVGVEGLSGAVQGAVQAAVRERLEAWAAQFTDDGAAAAKPVTVQADLAWAEEFAPRLQALMAQQPADDADRVAYLALSLAREVNNSIDEVTAQVNARLSVTHEGTSRGGHARVVLTGGGDVAGVRYDKRWLANAHEVTISRETTEAFQAAYLRLGRDGIADIIARSALGEVQRLGRDPQALARELGLRGERRD